MSNPEWQKDRYRTNWKRRLTVLLGVARSRKSESNITVQDLLDQLETQNHADYYSGIPLSLEVNGRRAFNVSLDRLDNSKPYDRGNVVLTIFAINRAKSDLSMAEFLRLCRSVADRYQK